MAALAELSSPGCCPGHRLQDRGVLLPQSVSCPTAHLRACLHVFLLAFQEGNTSEEAAFHLVLISISCQAAIPPLQPAIHFSRKSAVTRALCPPAFAPWRSKAVLDGAFKTLGLVDLA